MIKSTIKNNELDIMVSGNENAVLAEFKAISKALLSTIKTSRVVNSFFQSAFELNINPDDLFKEEENAKE